MKGGATARRKDDIHENVTIWQIAHPCQRQTRKRKVPPKIEMSGHATESPFHLPHSQYVIFSDKQIRNVYNILSLDFRSE